MDSTWSKSEFRILVLGGKEELVARVSNSQFGTNVGRRRRYARNISEALAILESEDEGINQIIIEAFMDNREHETPFQFLEVLRKSPYADIPVLVVAGEPGPVGTSLIHCVEQTTNKFGAEFVVLTCFDPDDVNFPPAKLIAENKGAKQH